jgi:hypothetical protein
LFCNCERVVDLNLTVARLLAGALRRHSGACLVARALAVAFYRRNGVAKKTGFEALMGNRWIDLEDRLKCHVPAIEPSARAVDDLEAALGSRGRAPPSGG